MMHQLPVRASGRLSQQPAILDGFTCIAGHESASGRRFKNRANGKDPERLLFEPLFVLTQTAC